ncbi:hypothetical protein JHK87_003954 [Glycine soja]|nr:hypothetical protein JHK87_003954 [Glycine soja]
MLGCFAGKCSGSIRSIVRHPERPVIASYGECYSDSPSFVAYSLNIRKLKDTRGYTLKWSHYLPSPFPEDTSLPCVIYCHGNNRCRADANEAAVILLPSNITVFTLDFSGSGLFDGDYVSLGWHEKDDLKMEVSYLRSNKQISRIGLWG